METELHALLGTMGVLCLSDSYSNLPMWAHYADQGRGICFEFEARKRPFFAAQQVQYVGVPPVINRLRDSKVQMLDKAVFTKGAAWSAEHEWRAIARPHSVRTKAANQNDTSIPTQVKAFYLEESGPGLYSIEHGALTKVILGQNISTGDETWIRDLAAQSPFAPQILRAVPVGYGVQLNPA